MQLANMMPKKIYERDNSSGELTESIKQRWTAIESEFTLKERLIIKVYEEVIIKNQLLNVCFDDMTNEKNSRENMHEKLEHELGIYKAQERTSQRLMVRELILLNAIFCRLKKIQ